MSLRSQVSPYVLIGNIADLPNPSSVAQCTLFHAADTGDCLILQIEPDTGVRHWTEFCGSTSMTGIEGPALIKFAGGGAVSSAGFMIADDPSATSIASGGVIPDYPLFRSRIALNFFINLRSHISGEIITVDLLVAGVAVMTHTFAALEVNGTTFNVPGPVTIPAGSKINVRVTSSNGTGATNVSATLELF